LHRRRNQDGDAFKHRNDNGPVPGPLFYAYKIFGSAAALDDRLVAVAPDHLGLAGAGAAPVIATMTTIPFVTDADRNISGRELDRGLRFVGGLSG